MALNIQKVKEGVTSHHTCKKPIGLDLEPNSNANWSDDSVNDIISKKYLGQSLH